MSASDVERKLAAILSADVVGYSRLMAEDEDATVQRITAYREQVSALVVEHRGRVVDFSGDNFLAEFPSALDAVECAVETQRVLRARNEGIASERRMEFRIGVHLGDVRIEGKRIYGDGVNIAARLETLAEPGGICISATVHEQVRNRLGVGFDDLGDRSVKNIPDQVHVYQVQLGGTAAAAAPERAGAPRRSWQALALVAAALVGLAAIAIWASWPRILGVGIDAAGLVPPEHPALPDKPSIVVLPFENMSGDPEQEYFADGITEDITTALSSTSVLFVISRNSAFTYKGRPAKVEDVGRELGVRYVLEGSVRRAGDQVRVTAQLIDATTGFHVWSDQYDRELDDIFAVQSDISERILGAVGANISDAELERIRRKPTENLTAYDAYARALSHFNRFRHAEMLEARRWLERAIELDPNYAAAVSMLGSTYSAPYGLLWSLDQDNLDRAEEQAQRSLALDSGLPNPHLLLGTIELNRKRPERAIDHFERARDLAPGDPTPHIFRGIALAQLGRQIEALGSVQRALRLNPRASSLSVMSSVLGGLYANTGRMDEAVQMWERGRADNPDLVMVRLNLADHYQTHGRESEAAELVQEALRVQPDLTSDEVFRRGITARLADAESFRRNLRAAGLP